MRGRTHFGSVFGSFLLVALLLAGAACQKSTKRQAAANPDALKPLTEGLARAIKSYRPPGFEANVGQFDARVDFVSRRENATVILIGGDAVLRVARAAGVNVRAPAHVHQSAPDRSRFNTVHMKLLGANRAMQVEPLEPLPTKINYFRGSDRRDWHSKVLSYSRVKYRDVYQGIDLVYYFDATGRLEYDFVIKPGASPGAVRLSFEGARKLEIDRDGSLKLHMPDKPVTVHKPVVYQMVGDVRHPINGAYALGDGGDVGFVLDDYDRTRTLWIDPTFDYSTYLGGSSNDLGIAIAVDATGNSYVTGYTRSKDFLTEVPWQSENASIGSGGKDVFVAKFSSTGVLEYSTYLGGSIDEEGHGIAVDGQGNAYITGRTSTHSLIPTDFPTTTGAFQRIGASDDVFVTKLDANGSLVASTLIGGSSDDEGFDIAIDDAGNPYVTGTTRSPNFPTSSALQPTLRGFSDAFVTKLDANLSALQYSTFLGGGRVESGFGIAVDEEGNASVVGVTESTDFPTSNAFQTALAGASDAFVTRLNAVGSAFLFSTYFGGRNPDFVGGDESAGSVAIDAEGNTVFAGSTNSTDMPIIGAFQVNISGPANPVNGGFEADAFVAKLHPSGLPIYSTYLGGNGFDASTGLALAGSLIIVSGFTLSSNFPLRGQEASRMGDIGAFKSVDGGGSWIPATTGLKSPSLTSLVIDPANPATLYAGTELDGVFKSTDAGETWHASSSGLFPLIVDLAIDPVVPSTLYAATHGAGVFKSSNGGATWIPMRTGMSIPFVISLAVDPTNPATLYAGTLVRGAHPLYKSVNGGANWTPIWGFETDVVAVDPSSSATVYAGSGVRLYRSLDGGSTWSVIFAELLADHITAVLIDPSTPSTLYLAKASKVFKSTDSGATWQAASTGLPSSALVSSLTFDPSQPQTIYAGTLGAGAFKTSNSAATWVPINLGITGTVVTRMAVDPHSSESVYVAAAGLEGDAFVSILDEAAGLVYSTYAGGRRRDSAADISVAPSGTVHLTGTTRSADWPISPTAVRSHLGFEDAFVASFACRIPVSISPIFTNPDKLWPPDHKMVPVRVDYAVGGGCGPVICSVSVTSNEPVNGMGDGDAEPDWEIVDARNIRLRAERSAVGTGRIYTVTATCSDSAGGETSRSHAVVVPLHQK